MMPTSLTGSEPKPATAPERFFLAPGFENWIRRALGIPRSPLQSLERDDDWTFVIKMHAIVEAALNHLLLTRLNNSKLREIIPKLDTNDRRKGKIAFIKAYDLLPEDCCLFVQVLSELRNNAVHNAKSFDLDLTNYVAEIKSKGQEDRWKKALSSWWVPLPHLKSQYPEAGEQHEAAGQRIFDSALDNPRHSIFSACIFILAKAQVQEMNLEKRENLQSELTGWLKGEEDGKKMGRRANNNF